MIALRSVARKSRALAPRVTSVASLRTHLHFKFEAEEAPESLGDTTKLNMCNAIKNAMGTVLKFFSKKIDHESFGELFNLILFSKSTRSSTRQK